MGATFTFKNDKPPAGLARTGWRRAADVKLNGKVCGRIVEVAIDEERGVDENYCVRFMVKHSSSGWVTLAHRTKTLEEMKAWVKAATGQLVSRYNLRFAEKRA